MKFPDNAALAKAKELTGYRSVKLDKEKRTVALAKAGMELDLGGIAKGYAGDEVMKVLKKHGIKAGLLAAGGDLTTMGTPPGRDGWVVGIEKLSRVTPNRKLLLKGQAASTSGDLQQFVVLDGVRYSHIIDPRTGIGLTERKLVTVIAPDGTTADSMTKVLSVLPPEKGLKLIEKIDGAAALIVRKTGDGEEEAIKSERFDGYLIDDE